MKVLIFTAMLFCAIALPALGELTDSDLDKIRLIINEEIKPIKVDIVSLKTEVAWIRGKLESVDKQFESVDQQFKSLDKRLDKQFESVDKQITHVTYITYGLTALIVAAIAIPQILIAWRAGKDRALERRVETLIQEIEMLKQQI